MWDLLGVPEQDPQSRARGVEGELSVPIVGANVLIRASRRVEGGRSI